MSRSLQAGTALAIQRGFLLWLLRCGVAWLSAEAADRAQPAVHRTSASNHSLPEHLTRTTAVRYLAIGLLTPDIRYADVPWLVQTQETFLMAIEDINRNLTESGANWRLVGRVFERKLLSEVLQNQSSLWQEGGLPASKLVSPGSNALDWQQTERSIRCGRVSSYSPGSALFHTLSLLQSNDCVAITTVQSDDVVRLAAPIAGALSIPVVTTNANSRLRNFFYKSLVHASLNDSHLALAVKDVLLEFAWHQAIVIYTMNSDLPEGTDFCSKIEMASFNKIKIWKDVIRPSMDGNGCQLSNSTKELLQKAYKSGIRIIVIRVHLAFIPVLFDYAHSIGLIGGSEMFTWLIVDFFNGVRLFPPQYWPLFEGMLILRPSTGKWGQKHGDSARLTHFAELLHERSAATANTGTSNPAMCPNKDISEVSLHAVYVYDAVLAIGDALSDLLPESTADGSWHTFQRDGPGAIALESFNLYPLQQGEELTMQIRNASRTNKSDTISPCCSRDYKLEILDSNAQSHYVSRWSEELLSLHREINVSSLLSIWRRGFPIDTPLANTSIRVLVVEDKPFIFRKNESIARSAIDIEDFVGPLADLWRNMTRLYELNYTLTVWDDTVSTTSVLVQNDCTKNKWDIVLGAISMRSKRKYFCNFSTPFHFASMAAVIRQPPEPSLVVESLFGIFMPFTSDVWLVLVVTLFFGAGILVVLDSEGLQTARRGHILFDAVFFAFSTLLGFGEHNIRRPFAQVFILSLQFMLCVIIACYTASLANMLSDSSGHLGISTPTDLAQKKVAYLAGSDSGDYITDVMGPWNEKLVRLTDKEKAEKGLIDGHFEAYFTHGPRAVLMAAKNCKLIAIPMKVSCSP